MKGRACQCMAKFQSHEGMGWMEEVPKGRQQGSKKARIRGIPISTLQDEKGPKYQGGISLSRVLTVTRTYHQVGTLALNPKC